MEPQSAKLLKPKIFVLQIIFDLSSLKKKI